MANQTWKAEPPYKKPNESFTKKLQGSCHCGRVKYWLSQDKPLASKYCHCDGCKVLHGKSHPLSLPPFRVPTPPPLA